MGTGWSTNAGESNANGQGSASEGRAPNLSLESPHGIVSADVWVVGSALDRGHVSDGKPVIIEARAQYGSASLKIVRRVPTIVFPVHELTLLIVYKSMTFLSSA